MRTITENHIRQMFSDQVYRRGRTYYKQNRVQDVSFDRQHQAWFAQVQGSYMYYVEIGLEKFSQGRINTFCDCPAFETYSTCKHIVAVLLTLSDRGLLKENSQDVTGQLIEGLLALKDQSPPTLTVLEQTPMKVEYYVKIDTDGKVKLSFKTGITHCYVVRNVRDFLDHVLHQAGHFFTTKFSYDPAEHYFLQQDMEIFNIVNEFIQTGDFFTDRSYYAENAYDRRDIPIPPVAFQTLLMKLIDRDLSVEMEGIQYDQVTIMENELPFTFGVTHNDEEELVLNVDSTINPLIYEYYRFIFSDGVFYFPTEKQLQIVKQVSRFFTGTRELPISAEQKDAFFSEVIPVLKKVSNVEISDKVSEEIVEYPLRAKLYLEQDDGAIIGKLTYHYGVHEINPFAANKQTEQILIRDVEKEAQIMHLIEQSNFHYNGKKLYINLLNDEEVYDFLYTILPLLNEAVELFLTKDIQSLIVEREPSPQTTVQVQAETNLLEIGFDISGVDKSEVEAMLAAVVEKKRFYRLQSGALVSLENEEFRSMQTLFDELAMKGTDLVDGTLTLPVYKGMQVDELIETKKNYDPSFRKLLHRLKSPEEQVYELPVDLEATLREYQETGYQWFKSLSEYHLGGILADDMGLGKTLQTITYLLSEPSKLPHLVIVPSSVVYNWRNECEKFAPSLEVAMITGKKEEREQIITASAEADVWITSYGTVRQDIDLYRDLHFQTLILDEAQFIKNYATKTSKAIREINALKRFALSGTPIENSLSELWAIFQVVLPGLMPNQREFNKLETEKVASLTKPFILRRVKEDVLKELPEKIESVQISELTKEQKELYVGYLQELQQEASASFAANAFQENRMKILAGLTRLRQLCCHPSLFIENYAGRSGKLDELMETVRTLIGSGRRMLIFSQFTTMHELIIAELEKEAIDYFYLHGQTPAKERVEMSEAFNNGEKSVFLISLRAGGTGLNLTGADTVILYDLWWNPAVEDQAAGRAHRFGQKNVVNVIRFIAEGTIEEKIYELQQKKRELIDQVIQPGETMLSSLSEEDVRELLSI